MVFLMLLVHEDKFFPIFYNPNLKPWSKGNLSLMDPTQIKKIHAMKRYKRRQFLDNLYFYSLIALTCSLFCCVSLCLPYLSSLVRAFFCVNISGLIPFLLSSKLLFIIGNLIIFVLIVNSRILSCSSSSATDVYYDEYIQNCQKKPQIPTPVVIKAEKFEKHVEEKVDMRVEDGLNSVDSKCKGWVKEATEEAWPDKEEDNIDEGDELSLVSSSDDLNKRAEDFIARVNRQRRLELNLLHYSNY